MVARLAIVGAALLFSTGGAAIKLCAMTAFQVACWRSLVAAVVLALVFRGSHRGLTYKTLLVAMAYAATMILFVLGNKLTTAANTIFLQSTAPLYILALSPKLLGERARRGDLWLMGAILLGLVLFFVQQPVASSSAPRPLLGNALSAAAGISYAFTLIGLRWLERDSPATATRAGSETTENGHSGGRGMQAVIAGNLIAAVLAAPFVFPVTASAQDVTIVAYLGVIQIGLAYVLLTYGFRKLRAFEASLIILLEPLFSPLWAWLIHGERPGALGLVGGALILLATALKGWSDSRQLQ